MNIGDRIRAARKAAGLSQEAVARRADLSLKSYGYIERGVVEDPHFSTLSRISDALGVPIDQLLKEGEGREPALGKAGAPQSGQPETVEEIDRLQLFHELREHAYGLASRLRRSLEQSTSLEEIETLEKDTALAAIGALSILRDETPRTGVEFKELRGAVEGVAELNAVADMIEARAETTRAEVSELSSIRTLRRKEVDADTRS